MLGSVALHGDKVVGAVLVHVARRDVLVARDEAQVRRDGRCGVEPDDAGEVQRDSVDVGEEILDPVLVEVAVLDHRAVGASRQDLRDAGWRESEHHATWPAQLDLDEEVTRELLDEEGVEVSVEVDVHLDRRHRGREDCSREVAKGGGGDDPREAWIELRGTRGAGEPSVAIDGLNHAEHVLLALDRVVGVDARPAGVTLVRKEPCPEVVVGDAAALHDREADRGWRQSSVRGWGRVRLNDEVSESKRRPRRAAKRIAPVAEAGRPLLEEVGCLEIGDRPEVAGRAPLETERAGEVHQRDVRVGIAEAIVRSSSRMQDEAIRLSRLVTQGDVTERDIDLVRLDLGQADSWIAVVPHDVPRGEHPVVGQQRAATLRTLGPALNHSHMNILRCLDLHGIGDRSAVDDRVAAVADRLGAVLDGGTRDHGDDDTETRRCSRGFRHGTPPSRGCTGRAAVAVRSTSDLAVPNDPTRRTFNHLVRRCGPRTARRRSGGRG